MMIFGVAIEIFCVAFFLGTNSRGLNFQQHFPPKGSYESSFVGGGIECEGHLVSSAFKN